MSESLFDVREFLLVIRFANWNPGESILNFGVLGTFLKAELDPEPNLLLVGEEY